MPATRSVRIARSGGAAGIQRRAWTATSATSATPIEIRPSRSRTGLSATVNVVVRAEVRQIRASTSRSASNRPRSLKRSGSWKPAIGISSSSAFGVVPDRA